MVSYENNAHKIINTEIDTVALQQYDHALCKKKDLSKYQPHLLAL